MKIALIINPEAGGGKGKKMAPKICAYLQERHIDFDLVFAEYWTHPEDQIAEWRHSSIKCAEVLVPHCVDIGYIEGAYVANDTAKANLENTGFDKPITIKPSTFFV